MADIFFSYAHADAERIAPIVKALEADGFSILWDPELLQGGADNDGVIEKELTAARCVIVAWSEAARHSPGVVAEAHAADAQKKLVPVLIEQVKPPIGFNTTQTEDLAAWNGDTAHPVWQRLILQLNALTKKDEQQGQQSAPATSTGTITLVVLGIAASVFAGLVTVGLSKHAGVIGGFAAVGVFFYGLFRQADNDLNPNLKALATCWLLPITGQVKVNGAEAFGRILKAVRVHNQSSWRYMWRSVLSSLLLNTSIFFALGLSTDLVAAVSRNIHGSALDAILFSLAFNTLFGFPTSVLAEHISLDVTRSVLLIGLFKRPSLYRWAIFDFVITGTIYFFVLLSVFMVLAVVTSKHHDPVRSLIAFCTWAEVYWTGKGAASGDWILFKDIINAGFITTYMTSLWLWLVVLISPVARIILWSRGQGLTLLGQIFNTKEKPFTAIGYVSLLLFVLAGGIASLIVRA